VLLFLLLCIVSLLAGVGILNAIRAPLPPYLQWLLAPGACLSAWAVALGVTVSLGVTVQHLVVPFWMATTIAACYGAAQARRSFPREITWLLALAIVLPVALMPFDFLHGLSDFVGGPAADGWTYVARGQELWEMPKNSVGHLAPLYAYASHLHAARFIASALLGVLSPFAREAGDTQAATGYFLAFSLFVFGASCLGVARTAENRRLPLAAICTLAVLSPWVLGAIQIHNYDNLLAISFLPMTMGFLAGLEEPGWRAMLTLGLFLAAAVYTYPEMAAFAVLGAALACARRALAGMRPVAWVGMLAGGLITALLLLGPSVRDLVWFISIQAGSLTLPIGRRGGEGAFAELGSLSNWWASFWGLTSGVATARFGAAWGITSRAVGTVCWILGAFGCLNMFRRGVWDVATVGALLLLGGVVMIVHDQYSYGAYKFLLLGWWIFAWFVVSGASTIRESVSRTDPAGRTIWKTAAGVTLAMISIGLIGSTVAHTVAFQRRLLTPSIRPYRSVQDIDRLINQAPLIVAVTDPIANEWAVYFLRAHPLALFGYQGPMLYPHLAAPMDQAATPDLRGVQYVLSDAPAPPSSDVIWQEGPYALSRIPEMGAAFLRRVNNPNGSERFEGQSFYWIGGGDTELVVYATTAGDATFFARFFRGPSLPGQPDRRLIIGTIGGAEHPLTIDRDGDQSFSFPVHAGENRIYLRALDRPTVAKIRGDTRPLLLGVEGLRVSLGPTIVPSRRP